MFMAACTAHSGGHDTHPALSMLQRMDADTLASEVSQLVQLDTVSDRAAAPSFLPPASQRNMRATHELLRRFYPRLFAAATVDVINEYSLLLTLPPSSHGEEHSAGDGERPALFMCHLDVVPIANGTEQDWGKAAGCDACGPFSGNIYGGYVWGRGAQDMKQYCAALLHAAERLLAEPAGAGGAAWQRSRTLVFALGHDEECGGEAGHAAIVEALEERGLTDLEFVHDEGLPIMPAGSSVINPDFSLALVGLAEKGYLTVRVECQSAGGHASQPPSAGSAITLLAAALQAIHTQRPTPALVLLV